MVQEKEEARRNAAQVAEEQKAVAKLKKQASVEKGTPALGRGVEWGGGGGGEERGRKGGVKQEMCTD